MPITKSTDVFRCERYQLFSQRKLQITCWFKRRPQSVLLHVPALCNTNHNVPFVWLNTSECPGVCLLLPDQVKNSSHDVITAVTEFVTVWCHHVLVWFFSVQGRREMSFYEVLLCCERNVPSSRGSRNDISAQQEAATARLCSCLIAANGGQDIST